MRISTLKWVQQSPKWRGPIEVQLRSKWGWRRVQKRLENCWIMYLMYLQALEEKERKANAQRENLLREQRYLRRRLELLSTQVDAIHKRRSVSECSTSTVSSSYSSHSESGKFLTFMLNSLKSTLILCIWLIRIRPTYSFQQKDHLVTEKFDSGVWKWA